MADKITQLRRIRKFLNVKAATLVYKNMILPILEYGNIFLSAASKVNRKRMQTLQNKALRSALQVDKYFDTENVHNEASLSKLVYRRQQHLLLYMYLLKDDKSARRLVPKPKIRTRASEKIRFIMRKPNTEKYKKCASYIGPKGWNALSA